MGCQFPIPLDSNNRSHRGSRGDEDEHFNFTDYYNKSILSEVEKETRTLKRQQRVETINNMDSRLIVVNAELEKFIRNDHGKVIPSKVKQIIALKSKHPDLSPEELIDKHNQMNRDQTSEDNYDDPARDIVLVEDGAIENLNLDESDPLRGYVWKTLTKLDSYKKNDFMSYLEICAKTPTELNAVYIDKDLLRVIPNHVYYSMEYEEGRKTLRRVLEGLSIYHEDLTYFNTIGFITAIVLLYLDEEDSFWMINYLLDSSKIRRWITQDRNNMKMTSYIFQRL